MARAKKWGRDVHGIVLVDKPKGLSSNAVLQRVKRLYKANKAGHTGALDPLATGVLPICLGEATKFSQYLLDAEKAYISTFALGATTTTADAQGDRLTTCSALAVNKEEIEQVMADFIGAIDQVPPMYSALKKDGQPLYKLARQGKEVERQARRVTIAEYGLRDFTPGELAFVDVSVRCSKGTYIRSLAVDLGEKLGCGAYVQELRRVQSGPYQIDQCHRLDVLEQLAHTRFDALDELLLPIDSALYRLPELQLEHDSALYFMQGQTVMDCRVYHLGNEGDKVRVFRAPGEFIGLGEIRESGRLAPRRLLATSS